MNGNKIFHDAMKILCVTLTHQNWEVEKTGDRIALRTDDRLVVREGDTFSPSEDEYFQAVMEFNDQIFVGIAPLIPERELWPLCDLLSQHDTIRVMFPVLLLHAYMLLLPPFLWVNPCDGVSIERDQDGVSVYYNREAVLIDKMGFYFVHLPHLKEIAQRLDFQTKEELWKRSLNIAAEETLRVLALAGLDVG